MIVLALSATVLATLTALTLILLVDLDSSRPRRLAAT